MRKVFISLFIVCSCLRLAAQCDKNRNPVVFIHGFLASGDTYALQIQRLIDQGYCSDRLFVFDWNSVSGNGKKTDSLLKDFINSVLKKTNSTQIDLVGHSAGGGLGRGFLQDSVNASNVAHYIHLGSRKWYYEYSWFKNNRCLNIYSAGDRIIGTAAGYIDNAVNLDLSVKDHYEVATCVETFNAVYQFLNEGQQPGEEKKYRTPVQIRGKAVELGSNIPLEKATVEIFVTDSKSGQRKTRTPVQSFITDEQGNWGPFRADPLLYYEIALLSADTTARSISYYFEPFTRADDLLYIRGFVKTGMMGMMLGSLPEKNDQSAIVIFSANKAIIGGRDSVTVNGIPVSSTVLTPAARTIISSFIFDDGDGKTTGSSLKQLSSAPFIGGVDIFLPSGAKIKNTIYYNGRKLILPAHPSSEKILLAVFK